MSIVRSLRAVPDKDLDSRRRASCSPSSTTGRTRRCRPGTSTTSSRSTMIRGALYRAAVKAVEDGEEGLYYDDIAPKVTRALGLARDEYALAPGEAPDLGRRTDRALRAVVNLRVYLDLDRGWRVTMPNLESTGLLEIGYLGLSTWPPATTCGAAPSPRWPARPPRCARRSAACCSMRCAGRWPSTPSASRRRSSTASSWPASRRCAGSGPWRPPTSRRRPPSSPGRAGRGRRAPWSPCRDGASSAGT